MDDVASITAEKDAIRIRMKNIRSDLHVPADAIAGERIIYSILSLPVLWDSLPESAVIGLYSPIRMEVNLLRHAGLFREKGLQIALPRISGESLIFSVANDGNNLRPGVFGILEPVPEAPPVPCEELYAVCVPGLAFDRNGGRLGYGKGYYDHFLQAAPGGRRPILIGVGYDFQLLDHIPQTPYDRRLDYIVTPSGTIETRL